MGFDGSCALVTGGARGIGEAISRKLHERGAKVAILDLNIEGAALLAAELSKSGQAAKAYACDVTDGGQIERVVEQVAGDFQGIGILVNNAGITRDGLLIRMTDEAWDKVLDTNLKAAFRMTRVVGRLMLKARQGSIVNIASVMGLVGNAGQANYSAAKAGLIGLTKTAAKEFGPRGVRVNAVAPGFIETSMTAVLGAEQREKLLEALPLKRLGKPEDVAEAVCFLASSQAAYITGQVLNICGGMVM